MYTDKILGLGANETMLQKKKAMWRLGSLAPKELLTIEKKHKKKKKSSFMDDDMTRIVNEKLSEMYDDPDVLPKHPKFFSKVAYLFKCDGTDSVIDRMPDSSDSEDEVSDEEAQAILDELDAEAAQNE